jgi:hypothetical protein
MRLDPARSATLKMFNAAKKGLDREQDEERKRRRLTEQYETGLDLLAREKWKQAGDAFQEVAKGNPDFRDVQKKLSQAQDELQRAQWYDEAIAHSEADRWAEACDSLIQLLWERQDYKEGQAVERLLGSTEKLLNYLAEIVEEFDVDGELPFEDALMTVVNIAQWEHLLFQVSHSKRIGQLSKVERGFICKCSQQCAQSQDAALLLEALDYPDPDDKGTNSVKRFAAMALGELGARFEIDQKTTIPKLKEMINDKKQDTETRWRAVWALGAIKPTYISEEIIELLCSILISEEEKDAIRWRAAWALGEMRSQKALDKLMSVGADQNEEEKVRRAAIRALGAIKSPEVKERLTKLSNQEKGKLGEIINWALQEMTAGK